MAEVCEYWVGESSPSLRATLERKGQAIDLSTVLRVDAICKARGTTTEKFTNQCVVEDATNGIVRLDFTTGDIDTAGWFEIAWRIYWTATNYETAPGTTDIEVSAEFTT